MKIMSMNRLNKKQRQEVITIIDETWHITKQIPKQTDREKTLKLFTSVLFLTNNFSFFAVSDQKIIGLIIGKSANKGSFLNSLYYGLKIIPQACSILFLGSEAKQYIKEYLKTSGTMRSLTNKTGKITNEVSLFAVSPTHQGMGVGKKLMAKAIQHYQSLDVKQFKLFTDTRCSYQFYDRNNFQLEATEKVQLNPRYVETIMLYAKSV